MVGKRSVRAVAAVLGLAATALVGVGQGAPAAAETVDTADAIRAWSYSETASAYWRAPLRNSAPQVPVTSWRQYSDTNDLMCPDDDETFACSGDSGAEIIGIYCSDFPGPRGLPTFAWIQWERVIHSDGIPMPWVGKDAGCDEPSPVDVVPMAEIANAVDAAAIEPMGVPMLNLWQRGTVVRDSVLEDVPVVLATDYPATVTVPVNIPRPGEDFVANVNAVAEFKWTWDGGSAIGRGTPYKPSPYPVKYLTATFQNDGTQALSLTATWSGTVEAAGLASQQMLPITISNTRNLRVF
jgi:hypothetical protein